MKISKVWRISPRGICLVTPVLGSLQTPATQGPATGLFVVFCSKETVLELTYSMANSLVEFDSPLLSI